MEKGQVFGLKCAELLANYDQDSHSLKMSNCSQKGGTRVLSDLAEIGYDAEWQIIIEPVLVQDTYARGSGLSPTQRRIPTPCALDASFPLDLERNLMKKEMKKGNWRGVKLPNYLNMFPTPKAFQDGTTPEKMEELEKENPRNTSKQGCNIYQQD